MDHKEKIDKIEDKINQLKAQKQAIMSREKEKERKVRTRRLIQIGAIIENMGIDTIDLADKLKSHFLNDENAKIWLNEFIDAHK